MDFDFKDRLEHRLQSRADSIAPTNVAFSQVEGRARQLRRRDRIVTAVGGLAVVFAVGIWSWPVQDPATVIADQPFHEESSEDESLPVPRPSEGSDVSTSHELFTADNEQTSSSQTVVTNSPATQADLSDADGSIDSRADKPPTTAPTAIAPNKDSVATVSAGDIKESAAGSIDTTKKPTTTDSPPDSQSITPGSTTLQTTTSTLATTTSTASSTTSTKLSTTAPSDSSTKPRLPTPKNPTFEPDEYRVGQSINYDFEGIQDSETWRKVEFNGEITLARQVSQRNGYLKATEPGDYCLSIAAVPLWFRLDLPAEPQGDFDHRPSLFTAPVCITVEPEKVLDVPVRYDPVVDYTSDNRLRFSWRLPQPPGLSLHYEITPYHNGVNAKLVREVDGERTPVAQCSSRQRDDVVRCTFPLVDFPDGEFCVEIYAIGSEFLGTLNSPTDRVCHTLPE